MLSLQFCPTIAVGLLGMHARLNCVHAEAVQGFTPDGHVQSFTQHVSVSPHCSGFVAQDGVSVALEHADETSATTRELNKTETNARRWACFTTHTPGVT